VNSAATPRGAPGIYVTSLLAIELPTFNKWLFAASSALTPAKRWNGVCGEGVLTTLAALPRVPLGTVEHPSPRGNGDS
jgi:hypothetical protein